MTRVYNKASRTPAAAKKPSSPRAVSSAVAKESSAAAVVVVVSTTAKPEWPMAYVMASFLLCPLSICL